MTERDDNSAAGGAGASQSDFGDWMKTVWQVVQGIPLEGCTVDAVDGSVQGLEDGDHLGVGADVFGAGQYLDRGHAVGVAT